MTLLEFIVLLIISALVGAIGQAIAGFHFGGFLLSAGVGFVGALIGVWLARNLGLPEFLTLDIGGTAFPIVWSIIGSALLVAILRLISR
ncbi:MAG: GlsB/YeaQ/YmgE family stress response membrane protein [Anaerolineales bacterium]|nr:GlsB/YeaQ/YmgE family stress response membrane protein [Anaerolineales bacterium]